MERPQLLFVFLHLHCVLCTTQWEKYEDVLQPLHLVDVITGPLSSR
jgi:hypothetical protein